MKKVEIKNIKIQAEKITDFKNLCFVFSDSNGEKKTKCLYDDKVWEVISITKDVLPLDNPPNTFNIRIERVIKFKKKS